MQRREMVESQIRSRGLDSSPLLQAMEEVPRHLFLPENLWSDAYQDRALPIGVSQNMPQPYLVALMTSLLELKGDEKVLEIGTGSGYQAAILAKLAASVYSIEIQAELGEAARRRLDEQGYTNVHVRIGDGFQGWPEQAPFDAILVTAATEQIPAPLIEQLQIGGRMVIPVGRFFQDLQVVTRTERGIDKRNVAAVRFEPMLGEAENPEKKKKRRDRQ